MVDLRMIPPVMLCYLSNTPPSLLPQAQKEKGAPLGAPFHKPRRLRRSLCGFLGLLMDHRGLVQNLENLGQRRLLVGLLHRAELTRQARRRRLENLPFVIALLGRI